MRGRQFPPSSGEVGGACMPARRQEREKRRGCYAVAASSSLADGGGFRLGSFSCPWAERGCKAPISLHTRICKYRRRSHSCWREARRQTGRSASWTKRADAEIELHWRRRYCDRKPEVVLSCIAIRARREHQRK